VNVFVDELRVGDRIITRQRYREIRWIGAQFSERIRICPESAFATDPYQARLGWAELPERDYDGQPNTASWFSNEKHRFYFEERESAGSSQSI